jgi:hypothetical protein
MSVPTATTGAAPAATSLASSAKFRTFAVTFAVAGTITYLLCLLFNWPMFTFHPAVNRFEWGWGPTRSGEGPTMYWYGWTATTVVAAAVAGFLATLLPESMAKRIPLFLVWLLPVLAIPFLIYDLRSWWQHP